MNKGQLTSWNDSRGFGFIKTESSKQDIFVHISSLKSMSRPPKIGDFIYFEIEKQSDGKLRAINCRIEGVAAKKPIRRTKRYTKTNNRRSNLLLKLIVVVIAIYGFQYFADNRVETPTQQQTHKHSTSKTATDSSTRLPSTNSKLAQAYKTRQSNVQVKGSGRVIRTLSDDNDGSRHQRFILKLTSGQTILIAHNIDLAPKIHNLSRGDTVQFYGVYEWNNKGGVVHWTHHDPKGKHTGGWLKHKGKTYQ